MFEVGVSWSGIEGWWWCVKVVGGGGLGFWDEIPLCLEWRRRRRSFGAKCNFTVTVTHAIVTKSKVNSSVLQQASRGLQGPL